MTLGDVGASIDIQGILSGIARDQISGFVQERIFGGDGDDVNGQPSLYEVLVALLIKATAGSLSEPSTVAGMAGTIGFVGPTEGRHTVPEYMCGAKQQEVVDLPRPQHKLLHRELQGFDTAVKVGAVVYNLVFCHKKPGQLRAPIAQVARTPQGRLAIVAGLSIFYE